MHFAVTHREVDKCPIGEREQWLCVLSLRSRKAVEAILVDGIGNRLGEVGLQFDRRDRDTIEEQPQIDAVLTGC